MTYLLSIEEAKQKFNINNDIDVFSKQFSNNVFDLLKISLLKCKLFTVCYPENEQKEIEELSSKNFLEPYTVIYKRLPNKKPQPFKFKQNDSSMRELIYYNCLIIKTQDMVILNKIFKVYKLKVWF